MLGKLLVTRATYASFGGSFAEDLSGGSFAIEASHSVASQQPLMSGTGKRGEMAVLADCTSFELTWHARDGQPCPSCF